MSDIVEPTQASAIAARINSNMDLLHAQLLEAIAAERAKLDELERMLSEASTKSRESIARTCEICQIVSNALTSDRETLSHLRSILAKEIS